MKKTTKRLLFLAASFALVAVIAGMVLNVRHDVHADYYAHSHDVGDVVAVWAEEDGTVHEIVLASVEGWDGVSEMGVQPYQANCCDNMRLDIITSEYHTIRTSPAPRQCVSVNIVRQITCVSCWSTQTVHFSRVGCGPNPSC